jgi:hypothetical protein
MDSTRQLKAKKQTSRSIKIANCIYQRIKEDLQEDYGTTETTRVSLPDEGMV